MVPIRGSVTPLAEAEAHRNKILSESTVESTNCRPSVRASRLDALLLATTRLESHNTTPC